jgi:hypothetical protein
VDFGNMSGKASVLLGLHKIMPVHSPYGSLWNRWDLHFHTPSSYDYLNQSLTDEQIIEGLLANNLRAVAITDHHIIDVPRIRKLQRLAGDALTILPGIELRSDQGGEPIHYVCIFLEDSDLDHLWTTLQGKLELTPTAIQKKGGNDRIYVPIEDGAREARKLGGVVSIHAGAKSNSIEGIKNKEQFQQRIKFDITRDSVDLMEIGQIKDIDVHLNLIFPMTGLDRPLIVCSDNHDISQYVVKAPLWFRADPTFRGLLMVLREPRNRVFVGDRPPELGRVEQNRTKYVRSISFSRKPTAPAGESWFSGEVVFNPGLVAIVGNKGSGKSALGDTLGLLGASKNDSSFSFLSKKRFRHPTGGFAQHFEAVLEWQSGEKLTRSLADSADPEEVERIKHLPQDHVEKVCNELVGLGEHGFEHELKDVIFSHVPETQRLGQTTLDDLLLFHAGEKQKRIDSLIKELRDLSRSRSLLEAQADPAVRRELEEKIKRRHIELEGHNLAKPAERSDPTSAKESAPPPNPDIVAEIQLTETEKRNILKKIGQTEERLKKSELRNAIANRLIEKIENFKMEFDVFRRSLINDATELGIDPETLTTFTARTEEVKRIQSEEALVVEAAKTDLDEGNPIGFRKQLALAMAKTSAAQAKLDAPNRAYQAYLKELGEWQEKRTQLEGKENDPGSLKGLIATLAGLASLPEKIAEIRTNQRRIALEIHGAKVAQTEVYRALYQPVQHFIDHHTLAKNKLKLEFRAELANGDFSERLLALIARNRRGTFMGIDEGKVKADGFVEITQWETPDSVRAFLDAIDGALHLDEREHPSSTVELKDQLLKGRKAEEVFDLLYGLEYLQPRYVLRWEGKDLSMLSPGERGTLLLVFYLLIDKGDLPLLIDQPEGNLDNQTVAKILVDCIREARKRRQVFVVTHNPNLAVVCDADQIVYAAMDKENGNMITYKSGALENPEITTHVTDVLEGTRWAFGVRHDKYKVGEALQ